MKNGILSSPIDGSYLNTAAEGLPLKSCGKAITRYLGDKAKGEPGRAGMFEQERECRELFARLLGATKDEVALVTNATGGINLVSNSLRWKAGDEILLNELEYPSNVYPWLKLRSKGVRVRVVKRKGWDVDVREIKRNLTPNTRLIALSHVSYKSGLRHDLDEIGELAEAHGARLSVDATQSLGVTPVSTKRVSFLAASSYKWLLGIHGVGVLFIGKGELADFQPSEVGWRSVKDVFSDDRFESYELLDDVTKVHAGMPNFAGIYVLNESLRFLLRRGIAAVERNSHELGSRLIAGLKEMNLRVMTPEEPERRAGIVAFEHADFQGIKKRLGARRVYVQGFDGEVRVSAHVYNDSEDVAAFLKALRQAI